jgi:glycosyltransferase involved in cell wall biosynthesis
LQRFSDAEIAATRQRLAPMLGLPGAPTIEVHNLERPMPKDARTLLLNMGLRAAQGRYLGFLDYDDLLYPEAYKTMVSQLRATDSAFASVRVVSADVYAQFIRIISELKDRFPGHGLVDLFRGNFCPLHSYLLDRHKIDSDDLVFDSLLTWEEDYDFLLQICAKYPSDFSLIKTQIGEYYYKTDGSNSTGAVLSEAKRSAYEMVSAIIEARRRITVVSSKLQQENGISPPEPMMTIREFLNRRVGY